MMSCVLLAYVVVVRLQNIVESKLYFCENTLGLRVFFIVLSVDDHVFFLYILDCCDFFFNHST